MKLIVGLGNKGKEYEMTRHNIGFMAIDEICRKFNASLDKEKFGGIYTKFKLNHEDIILLKPQKYINLSGEVLIEYVNYFKINIDDILIICDDLDLEIGKYKLKSKGSSGGHNGLKNIEHYLKTQSYKRLKIGISNNKSIDTKDYVLGNLNKEEQIRINEILKITTDIFEDCINISFDKLMNKYNHK